MALADILRGTIAIASKTVDSFKGSCQFYAWIGTNGAGDDVFAPVVPVRAIISLKKQQRYTPTSGLVMTLATLTITDPMADTQPNTGHVREQPVDPRDKFVLPDGGTAPIVDAGGTLDPKTGRGFTGKVVLGSVIRGQ